jgi:hypothetical protein
MSIHESNTHLESRSTPGFSLSAIIDAGIETFTIEMTRSVNGRTNFARRVELAGNDEIRSILASSGCSHMDCLALDLVVRRSAGVINGPGESFGD